MSDDGTALFWMGLLFGFLAGSTSIGIACESQRKRDLVKHGAAHYDPKSGKFVEHEAPPIGPKGVSDVSK